MTMVTPKTTRMGAYALVIMIVIVAEGKGDNRDVKKRAGMSAPCFQNLCRHIFKVSETCAGSGQFSLASREPVLDSSQEFLNPLFFLRQTFLTVFQFASFFLIHDFSLSSFNVHPRDQTIPW